jgi:MurNAc alpha-1-phosphate uridylyltransferase
LWDRAISQGRLAGLVHDGEWYHIGTQAGLAEASERLHSRRIEL